MVDTVIAIGALIIASAMCFPKPEAYINFVPEAPEIKRLRELLMARTATSIYEMRVRGGAWEARVKRGWVRTTDLLSGEDIG